MKTANKQESAVLDLGNSLLKGMIEGRLDSALSIPHAVKRLHLADFQQHVKRQSKGLGRGSGAHTFEYEGQGYVIGEAAEIGTDTRRTGGAKYARSYYAPLMIAILLRLYPRGHENLRIMAGFPPGDFRHVETLSTSLGGKHVVSLADGTQVVYKVRKVQTWDEPAGGLWNWLLAADGMYYQHKVNPSDLGLCVDIGGKISSLVPFRADGWIDYTSAVSIDIGIQDVMNQVSSILLATPEFDGMLGVHRGSMLPHDSAMRECLVSGIYQAGGYELNVLGAIADATQSIRTRIKEVYELNLGGSRPYRYIIVTGGGGGLMFAQLIEHVLNFNVQKVYQSHPRLEMMHFANLLGGDKILAAMDSQGAR